MKSKELPCDSSEGKFDAIRDFLVGHRAARTYPTRRRMPKLPAKSVEMSKNKKKTNKELK